MGAWGSTSLLPYTFIVEHEEVPLDEKDDYCGQLIIHRLGLQVEDDWYSAKAVREAVHQVCEDEERFEKVIERLGIDFDSFKGIENRAEVMELCLWKVINPDFWATHWEEHPNKERVKNWMEIHDRLGNELNEVLDDGDGDIDLEAFETMKLKLETHQSFEDEELFVFFEKEVPDSALEIRMLRSIHADILHAADKVQLSPFNNEELHEIYESYRQFEFLHMKMEERIVLHRWMALSYGQYEDYRDSISWKYKSMY